MNYSVISILSFILSAILFALAVCALIFNVYAVEVTLLCLVGLLVQFAVTVRAIRRAREIEQIVIALGQERPGPGTYTRFTISYGKR